MSKQNNELIDIAEDTLKCLLVAATDAYLEGYKLEPSYVKSMVESTMSQIRKIRERAIRNTNGR